MKMDDELTKIVRELRDVRESYAIARSEIPERAGSFARFIESADRLDDSALQLEGWFDEHGANELKSPHRHPEGWVGPAAATSCVCPARGVPGCDGSSPRCGPGRLRGIGKHRLYTARVRPRRPPHFTRLVAQLRCGTNRRDWKDMGRPKVDDPVPELNRKHHETIVIYPGCVEGTWRSHVSVEMQEDRDFDHFEAGETYRAPKRIDCRG